MTDAAVTIIGAGAVGLAIAECLSNEYSSVFVTEKNRTFGQETSSRNSEVIHAGIYYPPGSLKASLCVEGKEMLYRFCTRWDVPFNNCGKLIVATTPDETGKIKTIINNASDNGVRDLRVLSHDEIKQLEPDIFALTAILSPSTGVIDSHALMKRLETNFINNGGNIAYGNEVTGIEKISGGYEVTVTDAAGSNFTFTSGVIVNSAGLFSDKVSAMAGMMDSELEIVFCKGEYFRLKAPKNKLIRRLIYPVPQHNLSGLGIHVTIDLGGGVKLGPDVTWMADKKPDYSIDASKQESFFNSVRRFLPFVEYDDIMPDMAGIRPKIQKPGGPVKDFYIMEESYRGYPGFVNLIGIESPGLTSCLAIGKYVRDLLNMKGFSGDKDHS
jgi:L-2-hydroxyglutarate oxidase LhgO